MTPRGLGVGVPPLGGETDSVYTIEVLERLNPPWWHDWRHGQLGLRGYVPSVWSMDVESVALALDVATAHVQLPMWLLGNEPEREDQSDTPAHIAAAACREWVRRLGTWAVPWACPGVNVSVHMWVQAEPWLDVYLAEKGPVPHAWHVHIYGGPEAFDSALAQFRRWMHRRNVVRPVIVSECGDGEQPAATMAAIRGAIARGDIQAAAWFSSYYEPWNETGLLDAGGALTAAGAAYVGLAAAGDVHTAYLPVVRG